MDKVVSGYTVGQRYRMTWAGGTRDGVVVGETYADGLPTGARFVCVEWEDGTRDGVDTRDDLPTLTVCDCCLSLLANGDESSCRDYYGHTHPSGTFPANTVPGDDSDTETRFRAWVCDGCGEDGGVYAHTVYVIEVSA